MIDILAIPVIGAAGYALHRLGRTRAARRADILRPCATLLAEPAHGQDRAGYGTLEGRFAGMPVAIRLIAEAAAFRRLPQLWISVSAHRPTGFPGTLDILRRPSGAEFYAAAADLPVRYAVPEAWPGETLVRGSNGAEALLARAALPVASILSEPRVKEVLLTPRGARIVSQLCEGDRGAYLLLRDSRFSLAQVDPERLRPLLVQVTDLAGGPITEDALHDEDPRAAT